MILIPMLVQGLLFFQLYRLVDSSDAASRKRAEQAAHVQELGHLIEVSTFTWGTVLTSMLQKAAGAPLNDAPGNNAADKIDCASYEKRMNDLVAKLKVFSPSPEFGRMVNEIDAINQKEYLVLRQFAQGAQSGLAAETSAQTFDDYEKLRPTFRPYVRRARLTQQLLAEERRRIDEVEQESLANRGAIKSLLFSGIALDIISTAVVLLLFLRNIADRLNLLMRNARLLPRAEPLLLHLRGADEIAYLDQAFHQAAEELQKSAHYRKAIMETMSQDLRAPIQTAMLTADQIDRRQLAPINTPAYEKSGVHIAALKRNLDRVVHLVDDHLTFDKLESGQVNLQISTFDLRAAVEEALDGLNAQAAMKSIELVNSVAAVVVEADRGAIIQVLANFVGNAIKYSPKSAPIFVSSQNLAGSVKVMILDDGPGLDAAAQVAVYGRFQQNVADGMSRQGFGLGLAICKLLVEQHGGKVGVTSTAGAGSTFWFVLPVRYTVSSGAAP